MRSGFISSGVLAIALFAASVVASEVDFECDILPILASRCALCHSQDRKEGDLSPATREDVLSGGVSGPAAVVGRSKEKPFSFKS